MSKARPGNPIMIGFSDGTLLRATMGRHGPELAVLEQGTCKLHLAGGKGSATSPADAATLHGSLKWAIIGSDMVRPLPGARFADSETA